MTNSSLEKFREKPLVYAGKNSSALLVVNPENHTSERDSTGDEALQKFHVKPSDRATESDVHTIIPGTVRLKTSAGKNLDVKVNAPNSTKSPSEIEAYDGAPFVYLLPEAANATKNVAREVLFLCKVDSPAEWHLVANSDATTYTLEPITGRPTTGILGFFSKQVNLGTDPAAKITFAVNDGETNKKVIVNTTDGSVGNGGDDA